MSRTSEDSAAEQPPFGKVRAAASAASTPKTTTSKSCKRRAAEAALASRIARTPGGPAPCRRRLCCGEKALAGGGGGRRCCGATGPAPEACRVSVAPCSRCFCDGEVTGGPCPWKGLSLSVPHLEAHHHSDRLEGMDICFSRVDSADAGKGDQENGPAGPLECGRLLGICDIVLLERAEDVPEALSRLRGSMRDPVIAVDLEWRPDILGAQDFPGIRQNRVALIQLATSSLCVLIRTCSMGFHLPRALQDFFRDPSICFVGYSWDSADDRKMRSTFKWGRQDFGRLMDLQEVAKQLGYRGVGGLGGLVAQVLGLHMPKGHKVATSNWEAKRLTPRQVQYAALDAFATGHLLRCLGLWHSSPSPCPACKAPLGVPLPPPSRAELTCPEPSCQRRFTTREAMLHHADAKQHPRSARPCQLCGRWCTSCPLREASHRPSITANR